jgi:hypothetical protein
MSLSAQDLLHLAEAKRALESSSLAVKLADRVGKPIDALLRRLPERARGAIQQGTRKGLDAALGVALRSLEKEPARAAPSDRLHRALVIASGAAGGSVGLAGLVVELPVSLVLMLRAIADHARAQGEDLSHVDVRLECLAVFAYGAPTSRDDAAEAGYFAARAALARAISQAAEFVAERGLAEALGEKGAPALVQLVSRIAQRFGVSVADKAAAQLVPLLGAAGGAAVNAVFMRHYQDTARAHFTVRRLERAHGTEAVRAAYERLPR